MERKSINFVRCLKCQKILQCSRYDSSALLQHIRDDHPEIKIVKNGTKREEPKNGQRPNVDGGGESAGGDIKTTSEGWETREAEFPRNGDKIDAAQEKSQAAKDLPSDNNPNFECKCPNDRKNVGIISNPNNETTARTDFNERQGIANNPHTFIEGYPRPRLNQEDSYYIPEEDLTQYSITSELLAKYPEIKNSEFCPRDPDAKVIYTRRHKLKTPTTTASTITTTATKASRTPRKRHFYRTSIERWRPANGTIYCPRCGSCNRPLIQKQTERFTQNECCACFLLSCWPLCFLPCLLPGKHVEHLHCSNCKTFLGIYDRSANCIQPNRNFVADATRLNIQIQNSGASSEVLPKSTSARSNSSHLPSIVIDGKELHPNMVARLQRYKKFGSLAGIDVENFISDDEKAPRGN